MAGPEEKHDVQQGDSKIPGANNMNDGNAALDRHEPSHTAVAAAILQITGSLFFVIATFISHPSRFLILVRRTIITSALLSYLAGVVLTILATRTRRGHWPMMFFHAMMFADISMKLCAWYIGASNDLRVGGAFMLGTAFAIITNLILRKEPEETPRFELQILVPDHSINDWSKRVFVCMTKTFTSR
ncbi:hypothetical protein QM012_009264 [Aureobasidium pullulans]|uniref:Integral membrane protein n=1 Tax=Aureobasidium pullulans TaxID=5580 RepID=A0ABR0TGD4_AURPU